MVLSRVMRIGPIQRQSLISLFSLIGVTAIGYLATMYFAHSLGPAILGAFYLFTAYFGIFNLIGDGGFGGAGIKRISEGKNQNEFFTAAVLLQLVFLGISIIIFIILSHYLAGISSSELFYLFIISLIVGAINGICALDVLGTGRVGISQTSNFINTIVKLTVQVLAVFVGWGLGGLIAGLIAGTLASAAINFKFIRLKITTCNLSHVKDLSSFAFWSFLSSGGVLMFSYADTILIGYFLNAEDVGIYRTAFQLAAVSTIAVTAFTSVLFPRISRWHAENNIAMIQSTLSKAITYCLILAIPITFGGILLSEELMYFLYGASFQTGGTCLVILLFAQIANIFMYLLTMCLNGIDKPRYSFYVTLASAILNIILNIVLIQLFGINGAAAAMLITMVINAVLAYSLLRPVVKISLELRSIFSMIVSSLGMAFFVMAYIYFFKIQTFIDLCIPIFVGALIYFVLLLKIDTSIYSVLKDLLKKMEGSDPQK
jgi:O-antigen/teichoic acid export membrane protein